MSVISNSLASAISHAVATKSAAAQSNTSTTSSVFGPATNVTLSPAAQSATASQSSTSGSSAPSGAPAGGGGGVPITGSSSSSTDTELLVELADQEVIPKVGAADASEVVDSNGNIDLTKLNELEAQQAQAAAQQRLNSEPAPQASSA